MPYVRRYDYQGIEPLWDNVVRILTRDLPDELELIAEEFEEDPLPALNVYGAAAVNLERPFVVVEPDEDDDEETESGLLLNTANRFDILIGAEQRGTDEECVRDLVRYKRAVKNVLWSMEMADVMLGITATPPTWAIRGGRYRWVVWSGQENVNGRVVENMKLTFTYDEVANNG